MATLSAITDTPSTNKPLKYHGVLFDLDGTLLDTANDLGEALNAILANHNQPLVERARYRPVASDGAKGLLELGFGEQLALFDYEQLRAEFLDYYQHHIAVHTTLYPGIETLIEALDANQIPWGIVTNKPIGLTSLLLPHFPLLDSAGSVLGGDSLAQRKPHPAPLLKAAEEIGIAPEHCIYVGDAPRDIEASNAAGMYSIIANWGYIPAEANTQQWHAQMSCDHPGEMLALESLFTKQPKS
ncbi:phosphoglycolate phosphatase [Thalassotalea euphylliae]|uniref:phosphoglycolate phosphatase n=1 Tax=Thalassotalea euphylliae TaxID=1655234 RepID=A0A3E0TPY7_9GAMM|nr:phosphoglycolate phosphatase [Thalassotalea euphylliae]REL26594.1 phosphoglycolate phosphatase [Thalassotalea euphylliae]